MQYNLADVIALLLQINIPTRKGHGKLAASMKKNNQQHHNMKWVGGIIMFVSHKNDRKIRENKNNYIYIYILNYK